MPARLNDRPARRGRDVLPALPRDRRAGGAGPPGLRLRERRGLQDPRRSAPLVRGAPARLAPDRKRRQSGPGGERVSTVLPARDRSEGRHLPLDVEALRRDFPILARKVHGRPLVYLDNAATAQKPKPVLDAMRDFATSEYANVHR